MTIIDNNNIIILSADDNSDIYLPCFETDRLQHNKKTRVVPNASLQHA